MSILDSAELLLQAKNYSGSGPWLDESGNGHDAQFGSTSGGDANDPLTKLYVALDEQFMFLPGTAGNFASAPSVNLMNSDTGNGFQGVGNWIQNTGSAPTVVADTAKEAFGGKAIEQVPTSSAIFLKTAALAAVNPPLSAATEYTYCIWVKADLITPLTRLTLQLDWRDAGDLSLGTDTGTSVALVAGEYVKIFITATSPANTTYARTFITKAGGGDFDGTQTLHLGQASLHAGAGTTPIPSQRIIGDLDLRVRMSATDVTPSSTGLWIDNLDVGVAGYQFYLHSTGVVNFDGHGATGAITESTSDFTLVAGVATEVRITLDVSAGDVVWYQDGSSVGTDSFTAQALLGSDNTLTVGALVGGAANNHEGDFYWAEVRDGIDGPIVARFDARELSEPFATYTDPTRSNVWTVSRSATGYVSTIVDQNMFLLSTDDFFKVPDHAGLNFVQADSFTLMVVSKQSFAPTGNDRLIDKRGTEGYVLGFTSTKSQFFLDAATTDQDLSTGDFGAVNTLQTITGVRDAGVTSALFLDGGGKVSTADLSVGSLTTTDVFYIGANTGSSGFYEGAIVAVAVWRSALTDVEVLEARDHLLNGIPVVATASSGASEADLGIVAGKQLRHPRSSGAARRRIIDLDDPRRKYRLPY